MGPEFEKGDGRLRPSLQQRLPGAEGPPEGCSTAPCHAACGGPIPTSSRGHLLIFPHCLRKAWQALTRLLRGHALRPGGASNTRVEADHHTNPLNSFLFPAVPSVPVGCALPVLWAVPSVARQPGKIVFHLECKILVAAILFVYNFVLFCFVSSLAGGWWLGLVVCHTHTRTPLGSQPPPRPPRFLFLVLSGSCF